MALPFEESYPLFVLVFLTCAKRLAALIDQVALF